MLGIARVRKVIVEVSKLSRCFAMEDQGSRKVFGTLFRPKFNPDSPGDELANKFPLGTTATEILARLKNSVEATKSTE